MCEKSILYSITKTMENFEDFFYKKSKLCSVLWLRIYRFIVLDFPILVFFGHNWAVCQLELLNCFFSESETVELETRNGLRRVQATIEVRNITQAMIGQFNCTATNRAGETNQSTDININSMCPKFRPYPQNFYSRRKPMEN